ncbi:MAG: tyrosine-type recombinase/integrase [Thermoproteota archaeon]
MDPVENWLGSLSLHKSGSTSTENLYRWAFNKFLDFIGKSAEEINEEYWQDDVDIRRFKKRYAQKIKSWMIHQKGEGYCTGSIGSMVSAVKSFFKYNDYELGFVPVPSGEVTFHNRDITREEIAEVLQISKPRDRAFYLVMVSSGLRPTTICQLKIKDLEPDFSEDRVPCKVNVRKDKAKGKYHGYFTFITREALDALKNYLKTRSNVTKDSYLFTNYGKDESVSPKTMSVLFKRTLETLNEKGVIDYEQRPGKPAELRLYNLRKFFSFHAGHAGTEIKEFWMGHSQGTRDHYIGREVEEHRKIYKEQAAPFLRIQKPQPTETEKVIEEQQKQIEELRHELERSKEEKEEQEARIKELEVQMKMITDSERKINEVMDLMARSPEFKRLLSETLDKLKQRKTD